MLFLIGFLVAVQATLPFERGFARWVVGWEDRRIFEVLSTVSELGSTPTISAVTLCTLILLVIVGRHVDASAVLLIVATTATLTLSMKNVIERPRPDLIPATVIEDGFSFPSGHAAMSVAVYGAIALLTTRSPLHPTIRAAIIGTLIALIIAIGASRTYLGVHYPTDIVGGWLTGVVAMLLVHLAMPLMRRVAGE